MGKLKRGNILKGKLKIRLSLIAIVVMLFATIVSVSIGTKANNNMERVYAAASKATLAGEDFSAKFGEDVIFSVEKVNIKVSSTVVNEGENDEHLDYTIASLESGYDAFQGNGGYYVKGPNTINEESKFYFQNYTTSNKYVVEDGDFVMLNNSYNEAGVLTNGLEGSVNQEAIMISLGQYIIEGTVNNPTIGRAEAEHSDPNITNEKTAGITYLNFITATHNGNTLPNLNSRRVNADGGPFYDFTYIIPQIEGNEGYYKFEFEYLKGGVPCTGSFEFYLLFETSYTQIKTVNGVDYNSAPTMGWDKFNGSSFVEAIPTGDDSVRYKIGSDGIDTDGNMSYPTLTYDYTRYKAKITHTANRKVTKYDYYFDKNSVTTSVDGAGVNVPLVCTITNAEGTTTKTYNLNHYNSNNTNNILTILLTEQGVYTFDFEYIYIGYNHANAPEMNLIANEDVESVKKLTIHGFELEYSKLNYEKAQFAHYELAYNTEIDLIVPFGVLYSDGELAKYKNQEIGFTYELSESNFRLGTVLYGNTQNTLINSVLKKESKMDLLTSDSVIDANGLKFNADIQTYIQNDIEYIKTNQGSMWFDQNDAYVDSFYLHTATVNTDGKPVFGLTYESKILEIDDGRYYQVDGATKTEITDTIDTTQIRFTSTKFSNETSFNKIGYYLVFIKTDAKQDTVSNGITTDDFYQIFAFRYATDTIDITVKEHNTDKEIGAGRFTNKAVDVSWEKPGMFEKTVKGYYYQILNNNADRATLEKQTANLINGNKIENLGSDVQDGQFVKYLIKVQNEGDSATYKIFTIDRTPITGVNAYVVERDNTNGVNTYTFKSNKDGSAVKIFNAITDSLATLNWNDKASGANIKVTYIYAPFVSSSENLANQYKYGTETWIYTNYELGSTVGPFEFDKPAGESSALASSNIVFNRGFYVFTLTDEAGNFCKYSFVIDDSEAYFKVWEEGEESDAKYMVNGFLLSGENVTYSVGSHKAIQLGSSIDDAIKPFVEAFSGNSTAILRENDYYMQDGSNYSQLFNLFKNVGSNYYLTVAHEDLAMQKGNNALSSNQAFNGKITFYKDELNGATSLVVKLFLKGGNSKYSSTWADFEYSNSQMTIEINKDNSRGMVYYSSSQFADLSDFPTDGTSNRLQTGSERDGQIAINGAYATSADFIGFVWFLGTGDFEVAEVSYNYYQLNPKKNSNENNRYFYSVTPANTSPIVVYKDGASTKGGHDNEKGWFAFSDNSNIVQDGLYVVTRTYKAGGNYGEDDESLTYYFIVDRNEIIAEGIGDSIILTMMDEDFKEFNGAGAKTGNFEHESGKQYPYSVYLQSTKLPAVWQLPSGKYFSENINSGEYYAGQLKYEIWFIDSEKQISTNQKPYKLLELNKQDEFYDDYQPVYYDKTTGVFKVNLYHYLKNSSVANDALREKITIESNSNWLFLPGIYVLVIKDNVVDAKGETHIKTIGLEIQKGVNPTTEISSSFDQDSMKPEEVKDFRLTTSDEFVSIKLPEYKAGKTDLPQVDQSYLIIKQYYANDITGQYYVNYPYSYVGGYNIANDIIDANGRKIVENKDGDKYVYLDTKLKNDEGEIVDDLTIPLKYEITIRYKLNDGKGSEGNDEFRVAYHYYDANGKRVDVYESTYTIIIDRVAPSTNINNLAKDDSLISYYNEENGTSEMFEFSYQETAEMLFTYQYKAYYANKEAEDAEGKVYALRVTANTPYTFDEENGSKLAKVQIHKIDSFVLNFGVVSDYTTKEIGTTSTFGGLLGAEYGYYEILEYDAAGNVAQYVVYYSSGSDSIEIPFEIANTNGEVEPITISTNKTNTITAFGISVTGDIIKSDPFDNFYRFELSNANTSVKVGAINTNKVLLEKAYTEGDSLPARLAAMIANAGKGNYVLTIISRTGSVNIIINMYDSEDRPTLDIDKLIVKGDPYYIQLENVNVIKDGIRYYAKSITIIGGGINATYECFPNKNYHYYELKSDNGGEKEYTETYTTSIKCLANTTYQIKMTDVFGREDSTRFNTAGHEFYTLTFANNLNIEENGYSYKIGDTNYAFTNAIIRYDKSLNQTVTILYTYKNNIYTDIANSEGNITIETPDDSNYGVITIKALNNDIIDVEISFMIESKEDEKYHIVIDTRTSPVTLRDYTTGESKKIEESVAVYVADPTKITTESSNAGIMNLSWGESDGEQLNEYFDYVFVLYEHMNDKENTVKSTVLNGFGIMPISTEEDSAGLYHLEIKVYTKGGDYYLGNKVYTFDVQAINSQLFYVRDASGKAIKSNSTFSFAEISSLFDYLLTADGVKIDSNLQLKTNLMPLYVSNGALSVVLREEENLSKTEYIYESGNYIFKAVDIDATTYHVWFGLLEVVKSGNIVNDLKIEKTERKLDSEGNNVLDRYNKIVKETSLYPIGLTDFTKVVAGLSDSKINLIGIKQNAEEVLLKKNNLFVDIFYNNTLVATKEFDGNIQYEIKGNGAYGFIIYDLAGNVHEFPGVDHMIEIDVLREVVITINGEAPIDNAFYNDSVALRIWSINKYQTASISVKAYRNGFEYKSQSTNPYIFTDYGTYRVVITAKYQFGSGEDAKIYNLQKTVVFTIVNAKEARQSIDLTSLASYEIKQVLNPYGKDVTSYFKSKIININDGGMLLTYDKLMENNNPANLGVSSGKLKFTIIYFVKDEIYPTREVSFAFTMNNELPTIDCSLPMGETTNKGFSISFNAGIIYEQIGESFIYINGEAVYAINEYSGYDIQTIARTFDENGAGDYYIQLVTSSGNILSSYKVTIKEPLNFWAIIIIVVVAGVAITVATVIIVLRRKMRIR